MILKFITTHIPVTIGLMIVFRIPLNQYRLMANKIDNMDAKIMSQIYFFGLSIKRFC